MKLAWFSPLPPDHTEIGNVTARILPVLASSFDVTLYTNTQKWDKSLGSACKIRNFDSTTVNWKRLHSEGIPVYHIGNHIRFHGEIIRMARLCPGIVVLHDLALHETILNLCLEKGAGLGGYFDILCRYGGPDLEELGEEFMKRRTIKNDKIIVKYPLFEYVLDHAIGVITHNPLNIEPIRGHCTAPVLYAPLPFLPSGQLNPEIRRKRKKDQPYQIVFFGILGNPNRRLKPFLEAFAKCGKRDAFRIVIAGKYDEKKVKGWIAALGLKGLVSMRGFVPDQELDSLLEDSDLCINLRWPSRGESSATLLRLWNFSLPSLATDTAYYSTLPEETVALVDPDSEEKDIIRHLEAFSTDPEPYFEMGLAGNRYLKENHSAEAFAHHLDEFIPEVESSLGLSYAQTFGKRIAHEFISDFPDPGARGDLMKRCAKELSKWV
jgi:glycosyltransferase involved in cell wall biosynthesis